MPNTLEIIEQGQQLLQGLQFREASRQFEKALQMNAESAEALRGLGRLDLLQGREEEGLRRLDQAIALQPRSAEAVALKGAYFLSRGNTLNAAAFLEQARQLDPDSVTANVNLAGCHQRLGELEQAEQAVRRALAKDPGNYQAHYLLGQLFSRTGRSKEAIAECLEAVRLNPVFLKGYLTIGTIYRLAGLADKAIQLFVNAIQRMPDALPLREELCTLYAQRRDYASALQEAGEITTRRNGPGDWLRLGTYAVIQGNLELAERSFRQAGALNPNGWEARYNLAELYLTGGLVDEAMAEYQEAIQRGPRQWQPLNGLGLLLLHHRQNLEDARDYFVRALEIAPAQVEPLINLAIVCAVREEFPEAGKFCQVVLQLARPDSEAYRKARRLQAALAGKKPNSSAPKARARTPPRTGKRNN